MDKSTTRPRSATRGIETTRGILTYSQLAPLLAAQVAKVEERIANGACANFFFAPLAPFCGYRF